MAIRQCILDNCGGEEKRRDHLAVRRVSLMIVSEKRSVVDIGVVVAKKSITCFQASRNCECEFLVLFGIN